MLYQPIDRPLEITITIFILAFLTQIKRVSILFSIQRYQHIQNLILHEHMETHI